MKYPERNEKDPIQSEIKESTFNFEDLIQCILLDEDRYNGHSRNYVCEPRAFYAIEQDGEYVSKFGFREVDLIFLKDYNKDDLELLRSVIRGTLEKYEIILQLTPEHVFNIIKDQKANFQDVNKKLLDYFENINQILCEREPVTPLSNGITQEVFSSCLNKDLFFSSVISTEAFNEDEHEKLSNIFKECEELHRDVKRRYMTMQVLHALRNTYDDHLFNDKMEELIEECVGMITKKSYMEVKNAVRLLTPKGRYDAYEKLREDHPKWSRKKCVEIIDKEMLMRFEIGIVFCNESYGNFLNAYYKETGREAKKSQNLNMKNCNKTRGKGRSKIIRK